MVTKAAKRREAYAAAGLTRAGVAENPLDQFNLWLEQAKEAEIPEPNAMVLATVNAPAAGQSAPSQRNVLMKSFDADGLVFFTNHGSRKARQMATNAAVSAIFPWYALHRQVIVEGSVERVSEGESSDYFHSRPRSAQLGAWASRQSETLTSRGVLEERLARVTEEFGDREIPLPTFWGGYRIHPHRIEFWQGRPHRLHDRILYTRTESVWGITRLSP